MERRDERIFISTTDTIRVARRFVRERVEPTTLDRQMLADVELATSELVSNAVEYGSGDDYQVTIATTDDRFIIEVASSHGGTNPRIPTEWSTSDPESPSGRGLGLVSALSTNVWVRKTDDRVIVGCEFEIPGIGKMPLL